jgi:hypothetical protein
MFQLESIGFSHSLKIAKKMLTRSTKEVAEHTKETVQTWRDCASLRIVLQSSLYSAHQNQGCAASYAPVVSDLEETIFSLLHKSANRIGSQSTSSSDNIWDRIHRQNEAILKYCLAESDLWHEKTKNPNRKNLKALDQSISSQMEYVMNDPDQRALRRCRGATEEEYDDGPLYAAILKESVQKGSSGDAYAAMRMASKFGKKLSTKEVDRRASKGRKIRYTSIEKLVNFMSARPVPISEGVPITDEQMIDAFVNSVFR